MGETAISPPSVDPTASKVVSISTQIMIGTIIVLFFVVAFCLFLHLYAKYYWSNMSEDRSILSWRRQLANQRPRTSVRGRQRGLDPATLGSLPIVVYNPKDFKDGLECAVCLSEVLEGEKTRVLPKCNHGFHVECIDMWFKSHSTCPLCRDSVISDDNTGKNAVHIENTGYSTSESDNSDDEIESSNDSIRRTRDILAIQFPTNVLYWGNETQVSSFGLGSNTGSGSGAGSGSDSSSSDVNTSNDHEMVIDIPNAHEFCDVCLEEAKTPVLTRLVSLRNLLSFGRRVAPAPSQNAPSSSSDAS
ncbi:RING-H2 finger protein ATL3 [Amaranthus tricolor]|uniref:RING-H2 finger protein ATL3 n=1 Tax=Amaranthus tricolor TaxID=29722 RepID=UPI002583C5DD|nr:RING-H2 finger protein ATL3 [Amaranthus tricolor]